MWQRGDFCDLRKYKTAFEKVPKVWLETDITHSSPSESIKTRDIHSHSKQTEVFSIGIYSCKRRRLIYKLFRTRRGRCNDIVHHPQKRKLLCSNICAFQYREHLRSCCWNFPELLNKGFSSHHTYRNWTHRLTVNPTHQRVSNLFWFHSLRFCWFELQRSISTEDRQYVYKKFISILHLVY